MFRSALALAAGITLALPAATQDYTAQTANPTMEREVLDLMLRPLKLEQLQVEADAWLDVLAAKNAEISRQQIDVRRAEGEERDRLTGLVATGITARSGIVNRLNDVLAALTDRGGDATRYEQYVAASTGIQVDVSDVASALAQAKEWLVSWEGGIRVGLNVVKFLVTLLAFKILASLLAGVMKKAMGRVRKTSDLLRDFFVNAVRKLTIFVGIVVALSMLEVNIGPFLAAMGAAGFVIGFALQGTLSNFAAGIMILVYRPYDIGQVVTVAGTTGKVDEMTLVSTTLRLPDNQTVVVPNNSIWGDVITNVTGQKTRRVDMMFGCGYGDDLQQAQRVLEQIVKSHPKVLADPAPVIKLHALADSSVNWIVRPWARTEDYWDVFWDVTRQVKERFDQEGLSIPFPQRDVHLHQVTG